MINKWCMMVLALSVIGLLRSEIKAQNIDSSILEQLGPRGQVLQQQIEVDRGALQRQKNQYRISESFLGTFRAVSCREDHDSSTNMPIVRFLKLHHYTKGMQKALDREMLFQIDGDLDTTVVLRIDGGEFLKFTSINGPRVVIDESNLQGTECRVPGTESHNLSDEHGELKPVCKKEILEAKMSDDPWELWGQKTVYRKEQWGWNPLGYARTVILRVAKSDPTKLLYQLEEKIGKNGHLYGYETTVVQCTLQKVDSNPTETAVNVNE